MELSIEERRVLSARRPVTRAQVAGWVCAAIGIELGDRAIIEGHAVSDASTNSEQGRSPPIVGRWRLLGRGTATDWR